MICKVGVSHPGDAVNGNQSNYAGTEYLAVAYFFSFNLAEEQDKRADKQHNHLDDDSHGNRLGSSACFSSKMRQQGGEVAEDGDNEDAGKEDEHSVIEGRRQFFVQQTFGIAVNIFSLFRVFNKLLESRIVCQLQAAAIAP